MKLKRMLSLLMALVMTVSLLPLPVYAEDSNVTVESEVYTPGVNFTNVAPLVTSVASESGTNYSVSRTFSAVNSGISLLSEGSEGDDGSSSTTSGMVVNKTAAANEDGSYTITLETYATGSKVITTTNVEIPADIVLVLDLSSSMKQQITTSDSTTRMAALQTAVNNFIDSVYAKAIGSDNTAGTGDDVKHRIAIVGFNTDATAYTTSSGSLAFVDMNASGVNTTLESTVNNLGTGTGTVPATGINMANALFSDNPVTEGQRNRVVILFTDGYPSTTGSNNFTETYANDTISGTYTSKNTYGATVYTVAMLEDADPTADISSSTTLTGNTLKVNKYLHYA
ncbi:MAG: VWA domain-containing protein, partial [Anaerovoracaceae bacterium]